MATQRPAPRRIAELDSADGVVLASWIERAGALGFDAVVFGRDWDDGADDLAGLAAPGAGPLLLADVDLREPLPTSRDGAADPLPGVYAEVLRGWAAAGVGGVRLRLAAPPASIARLIAEVREAAPGFVFLGEGRGAPRSALLALGGCGLDAVISSLPYWDGRSRWLVEEYEALRHVAPVLAPASGTDAPALGRALRLACGLGAGLIAPLSPAGDLRLDAIVRAALRQSGELEPFTGEMRVLTGPSAPVSVLLRADSADVRQAGSALLVLVNPALDRPAPAPAADVLATAGAPLAPPERLDGAAADPFAPLEPGEVRLLLARRSAPVRFAPPQAPAQAAAGPRLVVEGLSPRVDGGRFPVRRVVGETVRVEADVFADGHEQLAAELRWRPVDEDVWRAVPMAEVGNDRWGAAFPADRLGRYEFQVQGWLDVFAGFRRDYRKKRDAGVDQAVDAQEGVLLVEAAHGRAGGGAKAALKAMLNRLKAASDPARVAAVLLGEDLAELMREADPRPWALASAVQVLDAEPLQARFASWYELFPRSQTDDPARHGTFDDVIARLPQVRAMGFDVLYFPPIHPIGRKNMKGRNNSLTPAEDDVGSPYAIGSAAGGHDAVHPELGTLDDFRRLVAAAADQELQVALDFAVQCSPDHPWLKQHPGWFDYRPDGSIKYAENPPKKYQDIVNVDFYKADAVPDLWVELRDIVLLWVREGVRLFRVDNPHTKPLAFWEWMIGEVRAAHPDVIFLAEAFTRPKVMYRLAKIGFSQSYTYFTWRHTKAEFIAYMTELTQTAPREFFRPHFFVNTPDINPVFLQTSGRGGFLIRAALAALLSGLFGVYAGFELCEAEPLPGREEYKDSEKYEIRVRPPRAPGDIVDEITRLNRIRRGHPALQTHLGIEFLPSWNDQVLVFCKATPALDDVVVAAVSLDPHGVQQTGFELPLWRWGLDEAAAIEVEDLVWEGRSSWRGKHQQVRLDPAAPYAVWSLRIELPGAPS